MRSPSDRNTPQLFLELSQSTSKSSLSESSSSYTIATMPGRLQSKIAIVTGSSSGLGRATALLYAKEGASILCADLRPEARMNLGDEGEVKTHDLIIAEGGKAIFVKCDVGKAEDWEEVVRRCVEGWGRVDM